MINQILFQRSMYGSFSSLGILFIHPSRWDAHALYISIEFNFFKM